MNRNLAAIPAITGFCFIAAGQALAAEGGSSHYLPGASGDIFLATAPAPGFQLANTVWFQTGEVNRAVLQGKVNTKLNLDLVLNLTSLTYTFEQPVLGGVYTIGAALPVGYASLDANLTGPAGGVFGVSADSFNISDMVFIPAQLNWTVGAWSFKQIGRAHV